MPENGRIANLALQRGSGEGYGSLPTDFGVVEGRSMGERVVTELSPGGYTPLHHPSLVNTTFHSWQKWSLRLHFPLIAKSALVVSLNVIQL
nr:hypothetical protein [Tanacetum cinerariifolium]